MCVWIVKKGVGSKRKAGQEGHGVESSKSSRKSVRCHSPSSSRFGSPKKTPSPHTVITSLLAAGTSSYIVSLCTSWLHVLEQVRFTTNPLLKLPKKKNFRMKNPTRILRVMNFFHHRLHLHLRRRKNPNPHKVQHPKNCHHHNHPHYHRLR